MGLMKKYFFYLFTSFLFSTSLYAYDAVIIVFQAPLLKGPSLNSKVLQVLRKGDKVYIPRESFVNGTLPEFVPTFDRAGNEAYIPAKYVKVISGTDEESKQSISYGKHDPTDYRLEEPIPASYPFEDRSFLRASISFVVANNTSSPYEYGTSFNEQNFKPEMGGRFVASRKVSYDKYDRFYFGVIGFITSSKNSTYFKNSNEATESRDLIRLGPWITYDAYRGDKYRLSIGTGFTLNYHRSLFMVENSALGEEERFFTGFSFSPMTSASFQVSDIFPNMDFVTGVDLSLFLPHSIKTNDSAGIPALWGETNQVSSGLKTQASAFIGVQVKY